MRMRKFLLVLLLVATAAPVDAQDAQDAQDARVARLRQYLASAAAVGHLNGSVLVAERGKLLVDTAFGFANIELGVRNTPETRFRVASVTKQFTAMAIAMLAEEGRLAIADPISKHLDSLPATWSGITIHHLLRHTSGISDYEEWFDGYTTQAYSDYMSQAHAPARIVRDAKARPLDHEPGAKFRYSNSAYILLGFIIERASGMPFDEFLRRRIHGPLGMTLSAQDRSEMLIAYRAQGYRMAPGAFPDRYYGGLARDDFRHAVYQLMEPPQADAGLITTARDLYKWDQALYTEKLVRKAMLDSIFTPGIAGYGYGWFVNSGANGVTHEHSGGLPGFACYIMRIPGTQRTIIVLGNVEWSGRTVGDIARILRDEPVADIRPHRLIARDTSREARLVGMYRSTDGDSVRVSLENGNFLAAMPGRFRSLLLPESPSDYFVAVTAGMARFAERDGRMTLTIEDALGQRVVQAEREGPAAPGRTARPALP